MPEIIPPSRGEKLTVIEGRLAAFFESVARLSVLDGKGSPEGVTDAQKTRLYLDTIGSKLYIKTTDLGIKTGWVALN